MTMPLLKQSAGFNLTSNGHNTTQYNAVKKKQRNQVPSSHFQFKIIHNLMSQKFSIPPKTIQASVFIKYFHTKKNQPSIWNKPIMHNNTENKKTHLPQVYFTWQTSTN